MTRLVCPLRGCKHFSGECVLDEVKLQRVGDICEVSAGLLACLHYEEETSGEALDAAYRSGQKLVEWIADEYKLAMPDAADLVIKQLTSELDNSGGCNGV
jgi:hypothetical protein